MTDQLRHGLVVKTPAVALQGEVEIDEVYVVAGHKSLPLPRQGVSPRPSPKGAARTPPPAGRRAGPRHAGEGQAADSRGDPARGPVLLRMLANVQQATIKPVIEATVAKAASSTPTKQRLRPPARLGLPAQDRLSRAGRDARDEDGDGFCEVHVNTMEGLWSLLRSWLRPHRGISQEKLPDYLGFFQFVHNARRRGKALLSALIAAMVT